MFSAMENMATALLWGSMAIIGIVIVLLKAQGGYVPPPVLIVGLILTILFDIPLGIGCILGARKYLVSNAEIVERQIEETTDLNFFPDV